MLIWNSRKKFFHRNPLPAENLSGLIDVTTDKVKQLASASSVAGTPYIWTTARSYLFPRFRRDLREAPGDRLTPKNASANEGAGAGAKVSVTPVAFIVKQEGRINIVGVPEGGEESGSAASGMLSGLLSAGLSALAAKKAQKAIKKKKTIPR